jgi:hypothetical protein
MDPPWTSLFLPPEFSPQKLRTDAPETFPGILHPLPENLAKAGKSVFHSTGRDFVLRHPPTQHLSQNREKTMSDKKDSARKTDKPSGFQINVQPIMEGDEPPAEATAKFVTPVEGGTGSGESGELPRSYGENAVFLIAQDPHRLFTYWDLDPQSHPGGPAVIKCFRVDSDSLEIEFEVPLEVRNWYIPVTQAGATYRVEIGYYRNSTWHPLAASAPAATPADAVSRSDDFAYATLPMDTAFSALLASLPARARHHPDLVRQLALLRHKHAGAVEKLPEILRQNEEAMGLLQAILGDQLLLELLSGSWTAAALAENISSRLGELLHSEASSELFARFQALSAESSLFSGLVSFPQFSAEELSSGAIGSATLSSWTESLISWSHAARHAAASEWLSSWGLAPGESSASQGSLELSSAGLASSWFGLFASSWSGQEVSSWAGSTASSWSETTLSSWFGESLSSWTAESLASWTNELLSSWSTSESGSWFTAPGSRDFFMHVNAEVIFYGGTDPQAKVTICDQPVTLQPDGTFHYHFVFPDSVSEIPIVATSPDGVETRKAVLRFERATVKQGRVDATGQPPLPTPLGRQR